MNGRALRCALGLAAATVLPGALAASSCETDGTCAADEVGLLQTHLQTEAEEAEAQASVPERHFVIDLRGEKGASAADACSPGIAVAVSDTSIPSNAALSYDFPGLTGKSSCSNKNQFGPTSCCDDWGSDATLHYNLKYGEVPTPQWTAKIHANIQAKIMWSYVDVGSVTMECAVCGASCTFPETTLAGVVTIAERTIEMLPCPTEGELMGAITLMLPDGVSVPMRVKADAKVELRKPSGEVVAATSINAQLNPPR